MTTELHDDPPVATGDARDPDLGWALAGLSAGAGVIHFAMTPLHAAVGWQEPLLFAAAGWFQLATAGVILAGRMGRRGYGVVALANLGFVAAWVLSRTVGLPWGDDPWTAEPVGAVDAATVALEVGVVVLAVRLVLAGSQRRVGRLAPALAAVGALGLATTVIASPDAAEHAHGDELSELEALEAEVDDTRCDRSFNVPAYWQEADRLGVDTRFGGIPPVTDDEAASGGHDHGGSSEATTATTEPDPYEGRGSPGLDVLVSSTGLAATSEGEAANLIIQLAKADDDDYDAWLRWLESSGSLAHEHSSTFTEEDGSGHGGHVGPQPWVALTDPAECDQLAAELELARETALRYPTVADAEAAGYRLTTTYVPGIAAHYIKGSLIDGTFEVDRPEMILYDGSDPDSAVVGLSYYLLHPGDNKPTQGFTGDNDHAHRHQGLCSRDGVIIGDTQTTAEECEAGGGTKSDGSRGWMSHAWVVPGCESPWGVFSAATPLLDHELGAASTEDGGGCAGSSVRTRYGMDGGVEPSETEVGEATTIDTAGG
ncbi:MAG: hypothetical protein KDA97_03870 [Acidimicrobiales bacterium]|nr:hypothetical protein [Acidimicrobiales bacterium]